MLSHVPTLVTSWTVACQASLSMGCPRQNYWSGLPFPSLGDLPDPGIEPTSPALAGGFFTTEPPGKPIDPLYNHWNTQEVSHGTRGVKDSILWQLNWWGEEDCVWEVEYLSGGQGKRKRHLDRCNSLHRVDVQTGIECWLTTRPRGWTGLQENWVDSNWGPWILSWWTMFPKPESICLECKVVEEREIHELRGKDW